MKCNQETISKIKRLRSIGYSFPEISRKCSVSKSTSFRYSKKIKILPEYLQRWTERRSSSKMIAQKNWDLAQRKAKRLINSISDKDLVLIGVMLYWAEGAKKDFSFSNTDPEMVKVFVYVLRKIFKIRIEDLKISIRIYEDLDEKICIQYWSKILDINLVNNKVKINMLEGSKKGKLKYGMCRIRVKKGGQLLKNYFSVIERICQVISACSSMDRTSAS